ncbi:MFS transporter [Methanobrevibacter sp.]|uniref:MFS transporter n=1 Tax=Methanobrevibacter sp. TaxID=66852 RepID=UPI002E79B3A3|nr:MFS transporter [Methanobrevibacter sp.]MEE0025931.1 MFS transporter [Methanobrevibacter sp.]
MNFNFIKFDWKSQSFRIILLAALCQFLTSMVLNCMHVMLPNMSLELGISIELLNWLTLVFLMTLLAFSIPISKYLGYGGVKKYMKIATCGLIIGLGIFALSSNIEFLLISRFIQGLNIAILNICVYMIIILGISENKVGQALGIVSSAGYVGMLISPTISGLITQFFGWRLVFIVLIIIFIFQLILIHFIKGEWKTDKKPIDNIGSLIFMIFICFLVYGLSSLNDGLIYLIIGVIIFIGFIWIEKNKKYPVFNLSLLKNKSYVIGNYAAMICHVISFSVNYILTIYLQVVNGLDSGIAGLVMMTTPIIMVIISPYAGMLADKRDSRLLSAFGMGFMTLGMIIFVFLEYIPFYMIFVALIFRGLGHGIFSSPNGKFVLTDISTDDLPEASALLTSVKEFGRILSLAIFTTICFVYMGNNSLYENISGFTQSTHSMMIITVIFGISSVVLLLISKFYLKDKTQS